MRPETSRHGFVDHDIWLLEIVPIEKAPSAQRYSQRREIVEAYGTELRDRAPSAFRNRLVLDHESCGVAQLRSQRQLGDPANLLDSWKGADLRGELLK